MDTKKIVVGSIWRNVRGPSRLVRVTGVDDARDFVSYSSALSPDILPVTAVNGIGWRVTAPDDRATLAAFREEHARTPMNVEVDYGVARGDRVAVCAMDVGSSPATIFYADAADAGDSAKVTRMLRGALTACFKMDSRRRIPVVDPFTGEFTFNVEFDVEGDPDAVFRAFAKSLNGIAPEKELVSSSCLGGCGKKMNGPRPLRWCCGEACRQASNKIASGSPLRRWLRAERARELHGADHVSLLRDKNLALHLGKWTETPWRAPWQYAGPPMVPEAEMRPVEAGDYTACPRCGRFRPGGIECEVHAQVRALLSEADVAGTAVPATATCPRCKGPTLDLRGAAFNQGAIIAERQCHLYGSSSGKNEGFWCRENPHAVAGWPSGRLR